MTPASSGSKLPMPQIAYHIIIIDGLLVKIFFKTTVGLSFLYLQNDHEVRLIVIQSHALMITFDNVSFPRIKPLYL